MTTSVFASAMIGMSLEIELAMAQKKEGFITCYTVLYCVLIERSPSTAIDWWTKDRPSYIPLIFRSFKLQRSTFNFQI